MQYVRSNSRNILFLLTFGVAGIILFACQDKVESMGKMEPQQATSTSASTPAANTNPVQSLQAACGADAQKFCMNVPQVQGWMWNCLEQHRKEVSPICSEKMAQMQAPYLEAARKNFLAACKDDKDLYCKDSKPDALPNCMKQNRAKFSAPCKKFVDSM